MTLRSVAAAGLRRLPPQARLRLLHGLGRFAPWEAGFDFTPPALEPGETTGPPDFVGIGVQKAGTTWWYGLIAAHPGVSAHPRIHKERHFLSRFAIESFGPQDVAAYHGWFPRRSGTLAGEWTPDYLDFPWVPPLLARAAPQTRLLLMVRDPVERFRSGLAHHKRHRGAISAAAVADAVARGFYHRALSHWSDHIDEDRLLILQYERCTADPAGQLARSYRFLGLDDDFVPTDLRRPVGPTTEGKVPVATDAIHRLVEAYKPDVHALATQFAEVDLALWPNFAPPGHVILVAGGRIPSAPLTCVVVFLILVAIGLPIARRQGRIEGDPRLTKLIMIALFLHFLGSSATIFVDNHVYHGVADFTQYVNRGAIISNSFRGFHFTLQGSGVRSPVGDGSVTIATGLIFSIVGINELATFFVFAFFSWLGSIFFYRAFCITFPEGGHRRYALMLFLLPSLLYWTSDVSKEAVMMLALGVTTLGAARVLARHPRGYLLIVLGTAMGIFTRPDEFAILFVAFTVALFFRRQTSNQATRAIRRLGTFAFLGVILGITAVLTAKFLHSNSSGVHSLSGILNKAHSNNGAAGLGSTNVPYSSDPLFYPRDIYYVLFDPLPVTARSVTQLIAAGENTVILVLILTSLRRLRLVWRAGRERAYVLLCAAYSLAFIYAFAALANLGLITRERTLVFPYLLVLLAIPTADKGKPPKYPWERRRVKRRDQRLAKARAGGFYPPT